MGSQEGPLQVPSRLRHTFPQSYKLGLNLTRPPALHRLALIPARQLVSCHRQQHGTREHIANRKVMSAGQPMLWLWCCADGHLHLAKLGS